MIFWKDDIPDVRIHDIDSFPWEKNSLEKEKILHHLENEHLIFFSNSSWKDLWEYAFSSEREVGGLLIGNVWQKEKNYYFYYIQKLALSNFIESSYYYLIMLPDIWQEANKILENTNHLILGWFHTHPRLGAFYSQTDIITQRKHFNFSYSLGMVIDPFQEEFKIFISPESILFSGDIYVQDLNV